MSRTHLERLRFLGTSFKRPLKSDLITSRETKCSKVRSFNTSTSDISPSEIGIDIGKLVLRGCITIGRVSKGDVFDIPSSGPGNPTAIQGVFDSTTNFKSLTWANSGNSSIGSSGWREGELSYSQSA
jgi:hypothetical protein